MNPAECTATVVAYANSADIGVWTLATTTTALLVLELLRPGRSRLLKSTLAGGGNATAAELAGRNEGAMQ